MQREPNSCISLVSEIVKRIEQKEHSTKFAENLLVEYMCYTICIAVNKNHPALSALHK